MPQDGISKLMYSILNFSTVAAGRDVNRSISSSCEMREPNSHVTYALNTVTAIFGVTALFYSVTGCFGDIHQIVRTPNCTIFSLFGVTSFSEYSLSEFLV